MTRSKRLRTLLADAKLLAKQYYALTGRPLGITSEVAESEAVRHLRLQLAVVRQPGYDALGVARGRRPDRVQIKGRRIVGRLNPGSRVGSIDLRKRWDTVLLVLLDANFEATAIYRANRLAVRQALRAPGSKARNERGQLSISKFKSIGQKVWPKGRDA